MAVKIGVLLAAENCLCDDESRRDFRTSFPRKRESSVVLRKRRCVPAFAGTTIEYVSDLYEVLYAAKQNVTHNLKHLFPSD